MTSLCPHRLRNAATAALCAALLLGCTTQTEDRSSDLATMREAMAVVHDRYVRDVSDDELTRDALKGMLAGLDPHSAYMDPKEYREFTADTRGEFGGIGASWRATAPGSRSSRRSTTRPPRAPAFARATRSSASTAKSSTGSTSARSSRRSAGRPDRSFG